MNARACGTCAFGKEINDEQKRIECHNRPPYVVVTRLATETAKASVSAVFPLINRDNWCNRYQPYTGVRNER